MNTPDNITELKPNEIFVFGSNTAGRHGAGAAKVAHDKFGAEYGVGEGLTGQSYALPTLNGALEKRALVEISRSALKFKRFAEANPHLTFYLTKVGCGLAGFDEEEMKQMFYYLPVNVIVPKGWGVSLKL